LSTQLCLLGASRLDCRYARREIFYGDATTIYRASANGAANTIRRLYLR